jgi:hypothetical protein
MLTAAAALSVAFLAGCGGHATKLYTLSATKACLDKAGYHTAAVKNTTLPSTGGNLRVKIAKASSELLNPQQAKGGTPPNAYIFLIFAKDPGAALSTEDKAVQISVQALKVRGLTITPAAVRKDVGIDQNVFFYSTTGGVTAGERAKFVPCLH